MEFSTAFIWVSGFFLVVIAGLLVNLCRLQFIKHKLEKEKAALLEEVYAMREDM